MIYLSNAFSLNMLPGEAKLEVKEIIIQIFKLSRGLKYECMNCQEYWMTN